MAKPMTVRCQEWRKHLRKWRRRVFWKRERTAGKRVIRAERQPTGGT